MYYDRDRKGLPRRWLQMMRNSMQSTIWQFSTSRMLQEYVEQLYRPAAEGSHPGLTPARAPETRPRSRAKTAA